MNVKLVKRERFLLHPDKSGTALRVVVEHIVLHRGRRLLPLALDAKPDHFKQGWE